VIGKTSKPQFTPPRISGFLRQHFADLHRGTPALFRASRNAAESERVTESRFMSAWRSLFYFGGQIGGQTLQQSKAGDGAMARTGCFPA
jgi:hypothetical protein